MTDDTNDADRSDWPTASHSGPDLPVGDDWQEYDTLVEAIEQYLLSEPPGDLDRWPINRVLAETLWDYRRERCVESHDLAEPAETGCIAPLIGEHEECPHNVVDSDDDLHAPPHKPPASDHGTLWLDEEGRPAVYSMHVYQGDLEHPIGEKHGNRWFDIVEFARHFGLEIGVRSPSWYNPSSTIHMVFYEPGFYR
jgi:hypothetical protein